ncbi:MAG: endonuclease/exonuclease/phosphatase family protein [Planctomycetota bacterium]|nr:endonuclease/exonuclease/phosphatase family protein [Planctomycetota bacterium]
MADGPGHAEWGSGRVGAGDGAGARWGAAALVLGGLVGAAPWAAVASLAWERRPYPLDLLSHFTVHLGVMAVLLAVALALLEAAGAIRLRWVALSYALAGAALLAGSRLWVRTPGTGAELAGADRVRIVFYNAYGEHTRHDNAFNAWLRDRGADIVVLIDPPWGHLSDQPWLRRELPFTLEPSAGKQWPIVIASRFPMREEALAEYSERVKMSFVARRSQVVRLASGREFLLTAMHPPSPRKERYLLLAERIVVRDGELIRAWRERTGLPAVVVGDFNSSPVGRVHRVFRSTSGLTGWSPLVLGGTWHAALPRWVAVAIDRAWTGGAARVVRMEVGPRFRSDHRPVTVEVEIGGAIPEQKQDPSGAVEPGGGAAR